MPLDNLSRPSSGLLGDFANGIDQRKQQFGRLVMGLLSNPEDTIAMLRAGDAEAHQRNLRTPAMDGSSRSVMPEIAQQGQEAAMELALSAGGLLGTKFYRGTNPGAAEKIATGNPTWDNNLFVATTPEQASLYGKSVQTVELHDSAKVLNEKSKAFRALVGPIKPKENLTDYGARAVDAARAAGYDAVNFDNWKDLGVAIINRSSVK